VSKKLLSTLVALIGVAAGVIFFALRSSDEPPVKFSGPFPLSSYYFEARIDFSSQAEGASHGIWRGWWKAPDRTRVEITCEGDPICSDHVRVLVAVGQDVWLYEPDTNTHFHALDEAYASSGRPFLVPSNYLPGPVPETLFGTDDEPWSIDGREKILGKDVTIFNLGAAIKRNEREIGSVRYWVDVAHQFALKQVIDREHEGTITIQVTKVDYDLPLDNSIFDFRPPPGSREGQLPR
jgi:outer membrane lipoprotein-sorting protein